jgi:hypothetical protein
MFCSKVFSCPHAKLFIYRRAAKCQSACTLKFLECVAVDKKLLNLSKVLSKRLNDD